MAARQKLDIMDTIQGMIKAINRKQDASDSDETIDMPTNRGNKLKRKAIFVHEGLADLPNGPKVYKETIEYAGYKRRIIARNPPRVDEDGYELEDDEIDEEADAAALAENIYGDIRLEELLAPLTSAADLPTHPTLSFPYLTNTLTELAQQATANVHKEKASLWRAKQLLMKFQGDEDWAPCGMMETGNDIAVFGAMGFETYFRDSIAQHIRSREQSLPDAQKAIRNKPGNAIRPGETELAMRKSVDDPRDADKDGLGETGRTVDATDPAPKDTEMAGAAKDAAPTDKVSTQDSDGVTNGRSKNDGEIKPSENLQNGDGAIGREDDRNMEPVDGERTKLITENGKPGDDHEDPTADGDAGQDAELDGEPEEESSQAPPHRMTTRAQALATTASNTPPRSRSRSRSPTPMSPMNSWIHPLFLIPEHAKPDPDFGLPPAEAAETRHLLLLYVQRQEEVVRGMEDIRDSLLKANRMRKDIFRWCKAEGHVGEMSDGEDWYDKEEWGLDEDLKKGKEEEEDDANKEGKKTRGRRA